MYLHNVFTIILFIFSIIHYINAIEFPSSFIYHHAIEPRAPETTTTTTTTTSINTIPNNNNNSTKTSIIPTTTTTSINSTSTNTPTSNHENGTIELSKKIDFIFNCSSLIQLDPYFCEVVANSTMEAIKEVDKVLNLLHKIKIQVAYFSYCGSDHKCNNGSYGRGTPSSQYEYPYEDGTFFVFPQALAKQILRENDTQYKDYDISIEINHDMYMNSVDIEQANGLGWNGTGIPPTGVYWFMNDTRYNQTTIKKDQIDFRYIILHQLIHGLGFVSGWAPYFWSPTSAFRQLAIDSATIDQMKIVTPGMHWYIASNPQTDEGPLYITGFQYTTFFDKFLYSINYTDNTSPSDPPSLSNLTDLAIDFQNFCVQGWDAYILHFLTKFSNTTQYQAARNLWNATSETDTLFFKFDRREGYYLTDPYLRQYENITLLTGQSFMDVAVEQYDEAANRPGASIAHLDSKYNSTVDFLMTQYYIRGQTLEDITQEMYQTLPSPINYQITTPVNNTTNVTTNHTYTSPIGPGILHILDNIGYVTVLSNVNYTLQTSKKPNPSRTRVCEDKNDGIPYDSKATTTPTNNATHHYSTHVTHYLFTLLLIFIPFLFNTL
ncbi:hypothetical protein BJ944DRAFT_169672 [Cunninghamella echinulata]|nr:hypothetical protein BJ944DRAFT_169672 [Cunninghamella echinulata]